MIVNLTQSFVDNQLVCPDGKKSFEYVDSLRTGLFAKVTVASSGVGTYYLRYKSDNKTAYLKIQRTNAITLAEARKKALQFKAEIASGNDPREQARTKKNVPTFSEFFTQRYMPYVLPRLRSANKYESLFRCHLREEFGTKRLNQITREQVQLFHSRLPENKSISKSQADHCIKALRASLNYACEIDVLEKNPIAGIKLFNESNLVENIMNEAELKRLLEVLHNDKNRMTCLVALWLISTGARLNSALQATWSNINQETKIWTIPSTQAKNKKVGHTPINDSALSILHKLGTEGKYEHLFINFKTGTRLKSIHTGWKTLREKAGLPHLRLHDLRHQYASMLVNDGRTLYEVSQLLHHSSMAVTQRYAHLSTKTLQEASQSASLCLDAAMAANS